MAKRRIISLTKKVASNFQNTTTTYYRRETEGLKTHRPKPAFDF
jgi:hypothetical protein